MKTVSRMIPNAVEGLAGIPHSVIFTQGGQWLSGFGVLAGRTPQTQDWQGL
jgi:hypothetical protein